MRKANILPIALMAFAIVGFLVLVSWAITPGLKWPWSTENTNKVTQTTTNTAVNVNVDTSTTTNVNESTNTNTAVNVNTSTNTNTATSPNANWKTYTNETYKYSIKYPETYAKITTPNGDVSVRFDKGKENTTGYQWLTITVLTSTTEQDTEMYSLYQWGKNGFSFSAPVTKYHQNPRREQLGQETFVVTDGDTASSGIPEYLLFKNDLLYYIGSSSGSVTQTSNRELIATMSFPNPTADWKTYTNTDVGYSVKYPNTWIFSSCPDTASAYFGTETIRCATEGSGDFFSINPLDDVFNFSRSTTELKNSMIDPTETTITVGGQQATRITGTVRKDDSFMTGGGEYKDEVYIRHNNSYVNLGYFIANGEKKLTMEFSNFLTSFTCTK